MMERTGRRGSWLDLAWVVTISAAMSTTACRDSKKEDAPVADAAPAPTVAATAVPVPEADAAVASATKPAEGELEDVPDSGVDGGVRKRRRLVAAGTDAGSAETQTAGAPAPTAEASAPKTGKRPPAPMGNDEVYGASAASAAPVLKKKPLPDDDPYPKAAH